MLSRPFSWTRFRNSAALPNENARRSLDVLLFDFLPFSFIAARCCAAELSTIFVECEDGTTDDSGGTDLVPLLEVLAEAADWGPIVTGLDRGDGLRARLATSAEEVRAGTLT